MATDPGKLPGNEATTGDGQLEPIELQRRFGDTIALDGLSFTMPRGEVFGVPSANQARRPADREQVQGRASAQIGSRPL